MTDAVHGSGANVLQEGGRVKLRQAAQEFESMLLADLLKMADQEKSSELGAMQGYGDMRIQAVASGLAARGGVGIAKMLIRQLVNDDTAERLKSSHSAPIVKLQVDS